jgi:hypothetical protein
MSPAKGGFPRKAPLRNVLDVLKKGAVRLAPSAFSAGNATLVLSSPAPSFERAIRYLD